MKQAFCTLLSSEDYLIPILILNRNLSNLKSQYPLLVMVTDNIINNIKYYLEKENINYTVINFISYSTMVQQQEAESYILNIASKLGIFTLVDYDKLIYIDADSIFLKNIDELFNYPDGAMYAEPGHQAGFAGMFVCIPKNHNLDFYLTILKHKPIWESNLLEELWFPYKSNKDYQIPFNFFINITIQVLDIFSINDFYGIHFCYYYKPWKYTSVQQYLDAYYKEFTIKSINRQIIIEFYFNTYLIPLWNDYPELKIK